MHIKRAAARPVTSSPKIMALASVLALVMGGASAGFAAGPEPGQKFHVDMDKLAAPYATSSTARPAGAVPRPTDHKPVAPPGFTVELAASDLRHPRQLLSLENGDVLVSQSRGDEITLLRDRDGDGRFEQKSVFVGGLDRPFGLAKAGSAIWFADRDAVWRVGYNATTGMADGRPQRITAPRALGPKDGHWTRNLALHPDGNRFYVAIGSRGNIAEEKEPRATIRAFPWSGGAGRTFAAGLRNPVGLAFLPGSDRLFTVVNERDGMGDDLVPDYLAEVKDGDFYGWPYTYLGGYPQPGFSDKKPETLGLTRRPAVAFQSHSAPIGLVFYDGDQFPADYHGDAFVALHGSWNSSVPRGYFVARVPFEDGVPTGGYEAFLTGFLIEGGGAWGRPAGLAVDRNGALLVSDDRSGTIWRVFRSK